MNYKKFSISPHLVAIFITLIKEASSLTPVRYLNLPNPNPNPGGKPPGPPVHYLNLPNPNPSLLCIIGHYICDHLKMCKNPNPNHKLNPEPNPIIS